MEFEFSLSGWQLGHPALRKPLTDYRSVVQQHMPDRLSNLEALGHPNFERDAAGRLTFRDFGWAGIPDFDLAAGRLKKGLGGEARITIQKYYSVTQYKDGRRYQTDDMAGSDRIAWESNVHSWYLKVLGQAPAEPPPPPPPVADRGDLAAFGIWPKSPLLVRAGQAFALDAMGVYLQDPFEAVKLNDRAIWNPGAGVVRTGSGEFRADAPGRYLVNVTITHKGRAMNDTIEVIVAR
jgi:hypothetical protein